ncbi:type II toxin-antitoxin system ParD family antitoxin [Candidatus Tisiphia endosymbiont of Nedyus quadrimaculatus]|uniref:type II toxin-antitoxin system ParD family antitoxin n=1 Tax=Candidatus Tisiphia endosymbiont of Nedyus quadrimaculatus TaxID=3139332 RepID=UPI00345ECE78
MNVSLTPELEKYVDKQVESGFYHSSSEVIRAALRLFIKSETQNTNFENYKMWLNQEIQIGLDQAAEGKVISGDQALQNFRNFRRDKLKSHE